MAKLIIVCKVDDHFLIYDFYENELDMDRIVKTFETSMGWEFNTTNCEIFQITSRGKYNWIAIRSNNRWTKIDTTVKNWEKYSSPAWVKHVKEFRKKGYAI